MSTEVAHLELRVTSDGYVTAENRFGAAAKSAEVFERTLNKMEAQQKRAEDAAKRAVALVFAIELRAEYLPLLPELERMDCARAPGVGDDGYRSR